MNEFFEKLFSAGDFMPHGHCYFWRPDILWTHVLSDGLIGISYFVIPLCLIFIARRRNDIKYRWMLVLFGIFIYSCGTTHLMNIVTVWNPLYRLDGIIKVITAVSSIGTALALIKITPQALKIPSTKAWMEVNMELKAQEKQIQEKNQRIQQSEQALRESEERYNTLRDIFDSVVIYQQNQIVYANPSAAHLLGADHPKALIGKSVMDFVHPDYEEAVKERLHSLKEGQRLPLMEQKIIRIDGTEIDIESLSVPFTYKGEPATQVVVRDISERKKQERILRESESKFRGLFESDMIGTMFWKIDGQITDANQALLEMIGYTRKDLQQGHIDWIQMTPAEFKDLDQQAFKQIMTTGVHAPYEKEYIRKDGTRVPIQVGGAFIKGYTDRGVSYVIDITERKKQEKELLKSEAKFRHLFELDMLGVIFSDFNNTITDANDAFLKMIGYSREELNAGILQWHQLTPSGYEQQDAQAIQSLNTSGTVVPYEKEYIRKDGSRVAIMIGAALLKDTSSVVAFVLDISEKKKQERSLQESEAKFRSVFESNMIGIVFGSLEGQILECNDAFLTITGYTREDADQQRISWLQMTPPEYARLDVKAWEEMHSRNVMTPFEKEYFRKDGTRVTVLIGGALLTGFHNITVAFVLDITEQDTVRKELKQHALELQILNAELEESQEVLRLSESRFRRMFESDLIGIVFWDKQGNLLEVNNLFLQIIGYSRADWERGEINWIAITPPEYAALDQAKLAEMDEQGMFTIYEKEYFRKDGTRVPILLGGTRLEGFHDRGVSYILDITSQKKVQRQLEERAKELVRTNEELEQFAYIASHDLQEPLRTMAGFANLLEKKYKNRLDQDANEFIEFIVDAAERMKKLITNLLEYSRLNTKEAPFGMVEFTKVVNKVVYSLQDKIQSGHVVVNIHPLPIIEANEGQMQQVFSHLLGNAIKFRDDRPLSIEVWAEEKDTHWLLAVKDTGIGINMAYATRIFQVFQRLHTRDKYEGTGIGLSVCKKIVEKHGGEIWVDSVPDQGSIFYFTIRKGLSN